MRLFRWSAVLLLLLLLPATASALEPYPTAHRFGISLGFGFGSAALSSFHEGLDDILPTVEQRSNVKLESYPKSNFQINAEIAFRYYFPYYILGHVGVDAVYNKAATGIQGFVGSVNTDQLAMEIPILVGGYYPFFGRLYVFGAIGPSPNFYQRSWISSDPGGNKIINLKADPSCGFHALAGAEFLVARSFAVGLELRYRYLKTGDLKEADSGVVFTPSLIGASGSKTYNLDLSGISLGITLRAFAL